MKRIFGNGRYANVTATVALLMAMGGTSYAAVTISGANIQDRSVKRNDLGSNSVTSAKVKNGALLRTDFKAGQVRNGTDGARGQTGETGSQGIQGPQGVPGSPPRLFAVVVLNAGIPTLLAQNGVLAFTENAGEGSYRIEFDQQIGNCAWVATPGGRNGGVQATTERTITLNGPAVTNAIDVRTGVAGTPTDMTFSVAVLC